jgi:phage-related protein (TIGR01555 family)
MEALQLSNLDSILETTYSTLRSQQTGLGTTRDKSTSYGINSNIRLLNELERNALFRTSRIAKKTVTLYPISAARGWCKHVCSNTDFNSDDLEKYFNNLQRGSLRESFKEVSIEARLHGDAYLLLGIEDGKEWYEPIDEKNIKSFRWVEPLFYGECEPDFFNNIRDPERYMVTTSANRDLESTFLYFQKSRIIRFTGDRLYGSAMRYNNGKNDSVLESFYQAFSAYLQSVLVSSAMLEDYSVFKYKLKGLAKLVLDGRSDDILQRFLTIQMGMGITKGLVVDADNEDAEFVSRNYGGVKDIIENLTQQMVANSDVPRYKLLGESDSSNSSGGKKAEQERFEWAGLVNEWQEENWRYPLQYCQKLAFLAKDGITRGQIPTSHDVEFENTLQLSPVEEGEMRLTKAKENEINIRSGIYTPFEVRESQYGHNTYSSEINLDEKITKKMREKVYSDEQPKNDIVMNSEKPSQSEVEENSEEKLDDSSKICAMINQDSKVKQILSWKNLRIALEVLPGEERFNKILSGVAYGHIQKYVGEDNKNLEVYVNEGVIDGSLSRVDISKISQLSSDKSGSFDEYKLFLGFSPSQAKSKFLELMPEYMFGGVSKVTLRDVAKSRKDGYLEILDEASYDSMAEISEIDILKTLDNIIEKNG